MAKDEHLDMMPDEEKNKCKGSKFSSVPQIVSQRWPPLPGMLMQWPSTARSPRLSLTIGKQERETQWRAHVRSLMTKWWFASNRDMCKQKMRAQEKGRVRHLRTTTQTNIWYRSDGAFCEQLWPWALQVQLGWELPGQKTMARPEAILQEPGMFYFLFRAFIARYWR